MAVLVIDIGNTLTKLGVFEQDELLFSGNFNNEEDEVLQHIITEYKVTKAILSSVKKAEPDWQERLASKIPVLKFNADMAPGIVNRYLTPLTLGIDRLAAIAGAWQLHPGQCSLVIDAGTTITYDYVDEKGNFFGGSISPGLNTRYKALNNYTAGLPLVEADADFNETYGNTTITAIQSGVQNGLKYELTGFIESYRKSNKDLNIILTGGDSIFFDTLLKNSIFAPYIKIEPHLVLKGLNGALQQHND
ncbi:pantothenate kinase [Mucilaginibacter hurinus]|uniref:Type III pantothenate kinase n=1 Tax=Mucilaginibacter hurinus TaxID=2201324 RepID=A0A367GP67_9SPHI|nr:type III pantothenate kinase [Mucilaginibacter hurinus]RCH54636.1 pantothenate kinase [Mucilaginibacter hurinus]